VRIEGGIMSFHIRQLLTAADHGSFYRAARALDIEHSTLSRKFPKLEPSLGMSIFERSCAGITLTPAGHPFVRSAKPMVATADRLGAMMRAAGRGRAGGLLLGRKGAAQGRRRSLPPWPEDAASSGFRSPASIPS
jgi:DNA-binding transcriptional LysR family regulator